MHLSIIEIVDNKLVSKPLTTSLKTLVEAHDYLVKREARRDWIAILADEDEAKTLPDLSGVNEEVVATLSSSRKAVEIYEALEKLTVDLPHTAVIWFTPRLTNYLERNVKSPNLAPKTFVNYYIANKLNMDEILELIKQRIEEEVEERFNEFEEEYLTRKNALRKALIKKARAFLDGLFDKLKAFFKKKEEN